MPPTTSDKDRPTALVQHFETSNIVVAGRSSGLSRLLPIQSDVALENRILKDSRPAFSEKCAVAVGIASSASNLGKWAAIVSILYVA